MQKQIPPGINYANLMPEIIENQVKIVKYTPVQTGKYKGGDVVRFNLQGNGFFDPYSTYLKFKVRKLFPVSLQDEATDDTDYHRMRGAFLDRSAHSIITRIVIRCQGQELERIEQYDVLAGMINDMIYSKEQKVLHHFEGFGFKDTHGEIGSNARFKDASPAYLLASNHADRIEPIDLFFGEVFSEVDDDSLIYDNNRDECTYQLRHASELNVNGEGKVVNCGIEKTFCIPIYSGLLGVLMPEKRLIPLSLMPLEIEMTINPYAFYTPYAQGNNRGFDDRSFEVVDLYMYAHVLYFEQEVHRSLEAVVAEHGIFLLINTFRFGPSTAYTNSGGSSIQAYSQINQHMKSINSVHWVFIYDDFIGDTSLKKLNFVSHRLKSLQVRNGTELFPSEPIVGNMEEGPSEYGHVPFLIETYKAWNKMHDPATDGAITPFNYCSDNYSTCGGDALPFYLIMNTVLNSGRCQYGISFEGEQLGTSRELLTGKRGLIPFDINHQGTKTRDSTSVQNTFCRVDFVIFVRPDLVVQVLGH